MHSPKDRFQALLPFLTHENMLTIINTHNAKLLSTLDIDLTELQCDSLTALCEKAEVPKTDVISDKLIRQLCSELSERISVSDIELHDPITALERPVRSIALKALSRADVLKNKRPDEQIGIDCIRLLFELQTKTDTPPPAEFFEALSSISLSGSILDTMCQHIADPEFDNPIAFRFRYAMSDFLTLQANLPATSIDALFSYLQDSNEVWYATFLRRLFIQKHLTPELRQQLHCMFPCLEEQADRLQGSLSLKLTDD